MEAKIITIAGVRTDDYSNTHVMDAEGNEYKVGAKRSKEIHDMLAQSKGLAVKFTYATYRDKDYIANAELVKDIIPEKEVEKKSEPKPNGARPKDIPGQQIGMTVKLIGDLIIAGMLSELFGKEAGWELIKWFRGEVLGTTKVPFDGAKLPQPKKD